MKALVCLKSEGIQSPSSFVLLSFFPRGFQVPLFLLLFLLFFTRFRKSSFFCFFLFSLSLFSLPLPLTLRLKKLLLSPWYVPSLSFRTFSLSLSFLEKKRKRNTSRARKCPLYGRSFFARARYASFFFNALRFFCKFLGEEKPSLPRRTSFKRKRRKSREFTLARPRFSRNFTDFTVSLISIAHFSCSRTR